MHLIYYFAFYVITVISTATSSFHVTTIDKHKPNFNATQRESSSDGNYYINLCYSFNFLVYLF
jgi:hypothetical protein